MVLFKHVVVFMCGRVHGEGLTNNVMELTAILMPLLALPERSQILICSDSAYSIGAVSGRNAVNANAALVGRCIAARDRHTSVQFKHVRGHKGEERNELADRLAGEGEAALPPAHRTFRGRRTYAASYGHTGPRPGAWTSLIRVPPKTGLSIVRLLT